MVKKYFSFLAVFLIIVLLFFSCSAPGGGGSGGTSAYTISLNIFDKDGPIVDSSFNVVETNLSLNLNSNTYELSLNKGSYNLFIAKTGYRAKGYAISLDNNISINVKLKKLNQNTYEYENIFGNLNKNNNPYTDKFNICAGIENSADIKEITENPSGDFIINSKCGTITVSSFTKENQKIDYITYEKSLDLTNGQPINGLSLDLPITGFNFHGVKPDDGDLKVKINKSFLVAKQEPVDSNYSFNIDLQVGDSVVLETVRYNSMDTYFHRLDAGTTGGDNSLSFPLSLPVISISETSDYFTITFDSVSGASCYESYVLEIVGGSPNIPFQTTIIAGNNIKIPKQVIDNNSSSATIYFSAVQIPGYDSVRMLAGSQDLNEYTYSETGKVVNTKAMSKMGKNNKGNIGMNYRQQYDFTNLMMDK